MKLTKALLVFVLANFYMGLVRSVKAPFVDSSDKLPELVFRHHNQNGICVGSYVAIRELGAGGFGKVYLVEHTSTKKNLL